MYKQGPYLACMLVLYLPLFCFQEIVFFAFFGVFSGDFGFLYSHAKPDLLLFLNYFLSVGQWAPFS